MRPRINLLPKIAGLGLANMGGVGLQGLCYNEGGGVKIIMSAIAITLELPESLVTQAQAAGILTNQRVAELLTAELERQARVDRYFDMVDRLSAVTPSLTQADIDAEITAYREEKRQKRLHSKT